MIALFFPSNSSTSQTASLSIGLSKSDMIALGLGIPSALAAITTLVVKLLRSRDRKRQTRERLNEKLKVI